jgi:hypothetical protein
MFTDEVFCYSQVTVCVMHDGVSEQGFREQLDMGQVHEDRYCPEHVCL